MINDHLSQKTVIQSSVEFKRNAKSDITRVPFYFAVIILSRTALLRVVFVICFDISQTDLY